MKHLYLVAVLICLATTTYAQLRMGIVGGPHSASVKEQNSLPSWQEQIKPRYSSRPGLNLGILVDVPLSQNNRLFLSPGLFYMAKGRKYYMKNDTLASAMSDTISSSHNLAVNYIDIPLNLTYKIPLGKKAKFLVSAGPYVSFFYNGKQTFETRIYSSNAYTGDEVKLETGNGEGKMKTFNAGWNARAGFELGSIILTGFMSEGLTSFYTAPYEGTFKHQVRGVSLGFWLNKAKQTQKATPVPKDTDKDGLPDNVDECPASAGLAITHGCPDQDGDGIGDNKDKCPSEAGFAKYMGCPVPDRDGDGMNDEEDSCPDEAGIADFNGCPVPDRDGDGLNDQQDKCPDVHGLSVNGGCPEIKKEVKEKVTMAAKNIFFKASSDQLTESSFEALDEVAALLLTNPTYNLIIDGHTDSTGSAELNRQLSQARADAVKNYLATKGISPERLKASGFGASKPLTSNATLEGRRKNRRVELRLR